MLRKGGMFLLTIALTVTLFFASDLFAVAKVNEPASVVVSMGRAHYQQIPDYASALGTLVAVRSTGLSFQSSGHLSQKLFQDGATVKKGDVIAKLDDSTIAAQLASAKANLEEAQSNFNRYELLKDSGVFSKQDYISVSTTLKVAKAKYASVLEQEQQLSLTAPFSGTLGKYDYSIGTQVSAGTVIVNLVQLNPLKVNYSLGQSEKSKVHSGQTVLIHSDTWPQQQFTAKVTYISPTVNPNTGRFDIEATMKNPKDELSPGSLVHVEHILGKGYKALVVPQTAVNVDEDRSYVYIVKDGKAHQKSVIAGQPTNNGNIIIDKGLKVGDEVVINGVQKLSEGAPVNVIHSKQGHPASKTSSKKINAGSEHVTPSTPLHGKRKQQIENKQIENKKLVENKKLQKSKGPQKPVQAASPATSHSKEILPPLSKNGAGSKNSAEHNSMLSAKPEKSGTKKQIKTPEGTTTQAKTTSLVNTPPAASR